MAVLAGSRGVARLGYGWDGGVTDAGNKKTRRHRKMGGSASFGMALIGDGTTFPYKH
jgi:hypothetical protein